MDELKQRVLTILQETFRDVKADISEYPPGKLSGTVRTPDFSEIDNTERQRLLRLALRNRLGEDSRYLSMLFTQSPEEYDTLHELDASYS